MLRGPSHPALPRSVFFFLLVAMCHLAPPPSPPASSSSSSSSSFSSSRVLAIEVPDIISGGESGGSIKVGIPWPKQEGQNPITALKYSVDGGNEISIHLDGKESLADGSDDAKRKEFASKRLFRNFLRTVREESIQRSNARQNTLTCPADMHIALGFALQFSSTEDEGTRQCIVDNNKACTTGSSMCSTKECEVLSEYVDRATASWTGKTLREAIRIMCHDSAPVQL